MNLTLLTHWFIFNQYSVFQQFISSTCVAEKKRVISILFE